MKYALAGGDPGALIRAIAELRPLNEASYAALAEIMGFHLTPAVSPPNPDVPTQAFPAPHTEASPPQGANTPIDNEVTASTLVRRTPSRTSRSRWNVQKATEDAYFLPKDPPPDAPREMLIPSLLKESWQRSILYTAMATTAAGEEIDTDRLVQTLAAMSEVEVLPRRKRLTLRRGGDILIDTGPGMQPFTHDSVALSRLIKGTMVPDSFRVLYFDGIPRLAGRGGRWTWTPYVPPESKPVLLVTDLGRSRPLVPGGASPQEWIEFAELLRNARCRPLVLNPYQPELLSDSLQQAFPVAAWDRRTTPGSVRRLLTDYEAAKA